MPIVKNIYRNIRIPLGFAKTYEIFPGAYSMPLCVLARLAIAPSARSRFVLLSPWLARREAAVLGANEHKPNGRTVGSYLSRHIHWRAVVLVLERPRPFTGCRSRLCADTRKSDACAHAQVARARPIEARRDAGRHAGMDLEPFVKFIRACAAVIHPLVRKPVC
jgi:hypothetical protein